MRYIKGALIILIVITGAARFGLGAFFVTAASLDPSSLMAKINRERVLRNIPALAVAPKLNLAADDKTRDMFNRGYFSHVDPDGNYVWNRIIASGYAPYKMLGENLALDFVTEDGVIRAWIDSPTHRDNLLRAEFLDQGLSAQYGTYENRYTSIVTSLFGTLLVAAAPPPSQAPKPESHAAQQPQAAPRPAPQPIQEPVASEATNTRNKEAAQLLQTSPAESSQEADIPVSEPERSESGLYGALRTIFMILIAALIITIFTDSLLQRRRNDFWKRPDLPMFLVIIIATLLTFKLY